MNCPICNKELEEAQTLDGKDIMRICDNNGIIIGFINDSTIRYVWTQKELDDGFQKIVTNFDKEKGSE